MSGETDERGREGQEEPGEKNLISRGSDGIKESEGAQGRMERK